MSCPECGMNFMEDDESERKDHAEYHDFIVYGPKINLDMAPAVIFRERGDAVVLITDTSPMSLKESLGEKVARCAHKDEEQFDGLCYRACDPPSDRDVHLFVYVCGGRGVGLLCLELRANVALCEWRGATDFECGEFFPASMWSIVYSWVNKSHRRRGIASRLLNEAMSWLSISGSEIGWYTPFTQEGALFAKKHHPVSFSVAK